MRLPRTATASHASKWRCLPVLSRTQRTAEAMSVADYGGVCGAKLGCDNVSREPWKKGQRKEALAQRL